MIVSFFMQEIVFYITFYRFLLFVHFGKSQKYIKTKGVFHYVERYFATRNI